MSSTTTFCKVCKDSGKPEKMFMNHNVKRNGITICPTLLSYECRYCQLKGHTIKFCTRKKKDEDMQKTKPLKPVVKKQAVVTVAAPANVFDCLESGSESESESESEIKEEGPTFVNKLSITYENTYASILKKEPLVEPPVKVCKVLKKRENKSWYDVYSDESDEEY